MSRMRTIKPGFFIDEDLGDCQPLARILFAGIWTIADREGRLEDRPKRIKVQVLPYDDCDVDALLAELAEHDLIVRYEAAGSRFIAVPSWKKHQSPHLKEAASAIPAPDEHGASTVLAPDEPPSSCFMGSCFVGSGIRDDASPDSSESDRVGAGDPSPGKAERTSTKTLSAPGMDELERRAADLLDQSSFPSDLVQLAELMAAENKTGKVTLSRIVRELYGPLVEMEAQFSQDAMRHGLRAAIAGQAPNASYVRKAAARYRPALVAANSAAAALSDYDRDFLTG